MALADTPSSWRACARRASWTRAAWASSACSRGWSGSSRAIHSSRPSGTPVSTSPAASVEVPTSATSSSAPSSWSGAITSRPPTRCAPSSMAFGGSVVVVDHRRPAQGPRAHRHPGAVFTRAARWGEVTFTKADDMRAQHRGPQASRPAAGDNRERLRVRPGRHDPRPAPDRAGSAPGDSSATRPSRTGSSSGPRSSTAGSAAKQLPTTSQPSPGDFVKTFRSALEEADDVVAVLVLRGALRHLQFRADRGARGRTHPGFLRGQPVGLPGGGHAGAPGRRVGRVGMARGGDRRGAGAGAGAVRALPDGRHLRKPLRSGRVSRGKAWLGGMLDVKPILYPRCERETGPDRPGPGPGGGLFRQGAAAARRATAPPAQGVRFGIAHAEAPEVAERVQNRVGRGLPTQGLLRVAGQRSARNPCRARGLGGVLSGGGRHAGAAAGDGRVAEVRGGSPPPVRQAVRRPIRTEKGPIWWSSTCDVSMMLPTSSS